MENNNKMSKDFIHWYKTGNSNDPETKFAIRYGENDVARKEAILKYSREASRRYRQLGGGGRKACRIDGCSTGARKDGLCAAHTQV